MRDFIWGVSNVNKLRPFTKFIISPGAIRTGLWIFVGFHNPSIPAAMSGFAQETKRSEVAELR